MTTQEAYQLLFREYPDLLNVHQMCEILGTNIKSAYKILQRGEINSMIVCNKYLIPKIELFRYIGIIEEYDDRK